jgi:hypothetical protein
MSAEAGTIFPQLTSIEIDEQGNIWLVQNHFESDSVIIEMESSAKGKYIDDGVIGDGYLYADDYDEDTLFGEDYL